MCFFVKRPTTYLRSCFFDAPGEQRYHNIGRTRNLTYNIQGTRRLMWLPCLRTVDQQGSLALLPREHTVFHASTCVLFFVRSVPLVMERKERRKRRTKNMWDVSLYPHNEQKKSLNRSAGWCAGNWAEGNWTALPSLASLASLESSLAGCACELRGGTHPSRSESHWTQRRPPWTLLVLFAPLGWASILKSCISHSQIS